MRKNTRTSSPTVVSRDASQRYLELLLSSEHVSSSGSVLTQCPLRSQLHLRGRQLNLSGEEQFSGWGSCWCYSTCRTTIAAVNRCLLDFEGQSINFGSS